MLNIYKASAGSGKTYTLAYEYLRLTLSVKDTDTGVIYLNHPAHIPGGKPLNNLHRSILAITFTNKATEEMKQRIIKELDDLTVIPPAGVDDANYAESFCRDLKCTREELAETASRTLTQLLNDYNSFHVVTIDSFFQRVLRTFARELDRPGDFSVELNDTAVVQSSVSAMLDDFNIDMDRVPGLDKWIYDYLSAHIDSGKKANFFNRSSHMHRALIKLVSRITEESVKPYIKKLREYLNPADGTTAPLPQLQKALDDIVTQQLQVLGRHARATVSDLECAGLSLSMMGNSNIPKFIDQYLVKDQLPPSGWNKGKILDLIEGNVDNLFKKGVNADASVTDDVAELYKAAAAVDILKRDIDSLHIAIDQLILLSHAWRYIDAFVAENNTVLLSDTNHLIYRIIGGDDTPFVYERLGMQLEHFLIDEFQDTSKMQWLNLKPLVANSMAFYHDNLIIGDEKQSIYRFRNADSTLLHHQVPYVDFPAPRFDTDISGDRPGQNTNYRSAADVVRFNNTLFHLLAQRWHNDNYGNVIQEIKHTDVPGYVHFIPFEGDPKGSSRTDSDSCVMRQIRTMVDNIIAQHERGYRWCDIAVLVNTNDEAATIIEYIVNNHPDIPIVSDEALLLRKSSAVQSVIGMLKVFAYRSTPQAQRQPGANRFPSAAETAVIISRYHHHRENGASPAEAVDMAVADYDMTNGDILTDMTDRVQALKPTTLPALVETIIHLTINDEARTEQYAYLAAFQDYVLDFSTRYNPSVKALLSDWETRQEKLSVNAAANIDAIKAMTVHKSKGLEFACVHVPFASWKEANDNYDCWVPFPKISGIDPGLCPPVVFVNMTSHCDSSDSMFYSHYSMHIANELEDTINKTYVAYTRAGRELIVYYLPDKNLGKTLVEVFKTPTASDSEYEGRTINLPDCFNADTGEFILGSPTLPHSDDSDDDAVDNVENSADDAVADIYNVYIESPAKVLTGIEDMLGLDKDICVEDDYDDSPGLDLYPDEEARQRGIMLHDILSLISRPRDIARAVDTVCSRLLIPTPKRKPIADLVKAMIDDPDSRVQRWFGNEGRVLNEQPVYTPQTGREKRLDRLVLYPDGSADIIDYKFTSEPLPDHQRQVLAYRDLIRAMGYSPVRAYLWYPLLHHITDVT